MVIRSVIVVLLSVWSGSAAVLASAVLVDRQTGLRNQRGKTKPLGICRGAGPASARALAAR
jgi:hypothetical protein